MLTVLQKGIEKASKIKDSYRSFTFKIVYFCIIACFLSNRPNLIIYIFFTNKQ